MNLPTPAFTNVVLSNPVVIADNSTFVNNPTVLSSGIGIGFDYDATTDDPNSDIIRVTINCDNYLEFTADLTVTARSIEFTGAHSFDSIKALVQSSVVYGTTNSQVLTGALPTAVSAKVGEKAVTGKFVLKSNPDAMQNAGAPNSASLLIAFVVEEEGISIEEVYPFTVTKKELTPSIATVISKDYDGDTTATGTIALSGAVAGRVPQPRLHLHGKPLMRVQQELRRKTSHWEKIILTITLSRLKVSTLQLPPAVQRLRRQH